MIALKEPWRIQRKSQRKTQTPTYSAALRDCASVTRPLAFSPLHKHVVTLEIGVTEQSRDLVFFR